MMLNISLFSFLFDCYHNIVFPLSGATQGEPPPPLTTPLTKSHVIAIPAKTLLIKSIASHNSSEALILLN